MNTPLTTPADILGMAGLFVALTLIHYLVRRSGFLSPGEVSKTVDKLSTLAPHFPTGSETVTSALHGFYRSWLALFTLSLPWFALCAGGVAYSFMRDHGFLIIPWLVIGQSIPFAIAWKVADHIKLRSVAARLAILSSPIG